MSDERLALHRLTRAAWHGIRMAGQNRPQLSIPPQPGDDDVLLSAVIDERDALLAALDAATARRSADEARYTDLWDAFHEEQRLRNRRVDWQEADTRELLRGEYGIEADAARPDAGATPGRAG